MTLPAKLLGPNGKPLNGHASRFAPSNRLPVKARYDAAQTTTENARHWVESDALSARQANSPEVRMRLRNRARYEIANNSYAKGIIDTLANDTVGTGPRLQLLTDDADLNYEIAEEWRYWSDAVCLPEKLRTMRKARASDGEAFALLITNPQLPTDVKLDIKLYEADQVATPFVNLFDPNAVDGIEFDEYGNPKNYHILKYHPGDAIAYGWEYATVPADLVIHWYRADRPGQSRGIPDITAALILFSYLRRYTLATVAAAEIAANFAAILYSTMAPADDSQDQNPFQTLEIERGMMTTLPAGWEMKQFAPEQPTTTYPQFKAEIINEIARCLNIPYNIAAGNSSGYNYSSGRLDNQNYYKGINVEQSYLEDVAVSRFFRAFLAELKMVSSLVPRNIKRWPHQWFWDGAEHIDPLKEADAQGARLQNGMTTYAREYARMGLDYETEFKQRSIEKKLMKELDIEPVLAVPSKNSGDVPSPQPNTGDVGDAGPADS